MAIAENNVSLLQIRRKDFLRILNDFPEIYDEVVDMAIRRKGVLAADGLENEKQRLRYIYIYNIYIARSHPY